MFLVLENRLKYLLNLELLLTSWQCFCKDMFLTVFQCYDHYIHFTSTVLGCKSFSSKYLRSKDNAHNYLIDIILKCTRYR